MNCFNIVILNYNNYEDTVECLESIANCGENDYSITLVDNGSDDGSTARLQEYFGQNGDVISCSSKTYKMVNYTNYSYGDGRLFIGIDKNYGYAVGNNIGICEALRAGCEYVVLLNNDVTVGTRFLSPIKKVFEDSVYSIGIASGKIYYFDEPTTIWFNGGNIRKFSYRPIHYDYKRKDSNQSATSVRDVGFITGCFWTVPTKVIERVGLLSEEYFMYIEDVDYCTRLRKMGYHLVVCEASHIWHKVDFENKTRNIQAYYYARNMRIFVRKCLGLRRRFEAYICLFTIDPLKYLIRLDFANLKLHMRGLSEGVNKYVER